jgi:hypothetical protein
MKIKTRVEALYELHDKIEDGLRIATRAGIARQPLWEYHDWVEREILKYESKLPPELVEEMIA